MKRITWAILLVALVAATRTQAQDSSGAVRIGTYDSRAVALAWGRSPAQGEGLRALMEESRQCKGKKARQEVERKGEARQIRLHQRVFSTAGAADLLKGHEEELAELARQAGVVALVSLWEMPFHAPGVELVDLTDQVAALFQPDEQTRQHLQGIRAQPPVPFDELPLDARF